MIDEESGKILDRMYGAMVARRTADPKLSKAAKLLQRGRPKIARKLGENVFETTIAAMAKDADSVVDESAKLLYLLLVFFFVNDLLHFFYYFRMAGRQVIFLSRVFA